MARYGAITASPEAGPKSTNLRGSYRKPLASHLHLCLRHEHRTERVRSGSRSHFRCIPAPIGGTVRADARVQTTGQRDPGVAWPPVERPTSEEACRGSSTASRSRGPCDRDRSANRWYATRRGRNPAAWFRVGRPDRPDRPVLLAVSPPGRCPECDARVDGWAADCDRCGEPLPARIAFHPRDRRTRRAGRRQGRGSFRQRRLAVRSAADADHERLGPRTDARFVRAGPTIPWPRRCRSVSDRRSPRRTTSPRRRPTRRPVRSCRRRLSVGQCRPRGRRLLRDLARWRSPRVFGPVDAGQLTVRHEGPVDDFDVTAMDDRVILTGRGGRSSVAFVFRTIGGMRAADLELALGRIAGAARDIARGGPAPRRPRPPSPEFIGCVRRRDHPGRGHVRAGSRAPTGGPTTPAGGDGSAEPSFALESAAPTPTPLVNPAVADSYGS